MVNKRIILKNHIRKFNICLIIAIFLVLNFVTPYVRATDATAGATDATSTEESDSESSDEDDDSGPSKFESAVDGIVGVLLLPAKFLLVLLGKVIELVLKLFVGSGGTNLSVDDIIFNKLPLTDINFFDFNSSEEAVNTIRENVAYWYTGIRNLAAIILSLILIYVGIRMSMSTVAETKAKYKKMLVDWITSLCLLFVLHYIMVITINVNNELVSILDKAKSSSSALNDAATTFYDNSLLTISFTEGFGNAICYVMLEGITFAFLISYIKRMITIGFLIVIAPLVTVSYSIDKMGDGRSQALNTWLKEFIYNILIQPFHCVTYLAIVSTAIDLVSNKADFKSATLAICMLIFMSKQAEEIVRHIFHFEARSMPSVAASAALGYTVARTAFDAGKKVTGAVASKAGDKEGGNGNGNNSEKTRTAENNDKNEKNASEKSDKEAGEKNKENEQNSENNEGGEDNKDKGNNEGNEERADNEEGKDSNAGDSNGQNNGENGNSNGHELTPEESSKQKRKKRIRGVAKSLGRGVVRANALVLGSSAGLALGGATGDLSTAVGGLALGLGIGGKAGMDMGRRMKTNDLKRETAREFNNVKEESGMTDEQVRDLGNRFLDGDAEAQTEAEKAFAKQLRKLKQNYRKNGMDEEASIKNSKKVLEGIENGEIGESWAQERFRGNVRRGRNRENPEEEQQESPAEQSEPIAEPNMPYEAPITPNMEPNMQNEEPSSESGAQDEAPSMPSAEPSIPNEAPVAPSAEPTTETSTPNAEPTTPSTKPSTPDVEQTPQDTNNNQNA